MPDRSAEAPIRPGATGVHRWAVAAVLSAFGLLLAGGLVTSRDAGLAVPDWPLSYGTLNPPRWYTIENVRTEHGHRLAAACVTAVTFGLACTILRRERRPLVRRLGVAAAAMILVQAVLGGLRVLHLSIDLAMVHGVVAQAFFCLLVVIATVTADTWPTPPQSGRSGRAFGVWSFTAVALIASQLVVGIFLRHLGAAVRPLIASPLFYLHLAVAGLVVVVALRLRSTCAREPASDYLQNRASLLLALIAIQIGLGVGSYAVTEPFGPGAEWALLAAWLPTLHVACGAAVLATAVVLATHAAAGRNAAVTATAPATAVEVLR